MWCVNNWRQQRILLYNLIKTDHSLIIQEVRNLSSTCDTWLAVPTLQWMMLLSLLCLRDWVERGVFASSSYHIRSFSCVLSGGQWSRATSWTARMLLLRTIEAKNAWVFKNIASTVYNFISQFQLLRHWKHLSLFYLQLHILLIALVFIVKVHLG